MVRLLASVLFFLCIMLGIVVKGQAQTLELSSPEDFKQCTGVDEFTLHIENKSEQALLEPGSYWIDWGDGEIEPILNFTGQLKHTYKQLGIYTLSFSAKKKGSSSLLPKVTYKVMNQPAQPAIGMKISEGGVKCVGSSVEFEVSGWESNTSQTTYIINFGDNQTLSYTNDALKAVSGKITHLYTQSHCQLGQASGITIKITADNGCALRSSNIENTYIVIPAQVDFPLPDKECTGNQIQLNNTSGEDPDSKCQKPTYTWLVNGNKVTANFVVFDEPGSNTVTLTATKGAECSKGTLIKTVKIIRRVKAVVTPVNSDICEGGSVALKGSDSDGDEKTYKWTVVSGGSGNVAFAPNATTADPTATFKAYGTYRLRLTVDNGCSRDEAEVVVIVKKDPVVTKFDALLPQCPNDVLNLSGKVAYQMNANSTSPTWTITPSTGWEWSGGSGMHSLYPQVKFKDPGDYTVTVKLDGVECLTTPSQLEKSQVIKIYDPKIVPDITIQGGKTDVCEGEEIVFLNNSTATQELKYGWTVLKNGVAAILNVDYVYSAGNLTSREPRLKFLTYGNYTVDVLLSVECNSKSVSFNLKVKKEPEVTRFDALAAMCPEVDGHDGILDLSGKVAYQWYNNTGKTPVWSVEPTTGWVWGSGYNTNSSFPRIQFTQKGTYTLKVALPTAGCGGSALEKSQTILIYDPVITKDIKIVGDRRVICETDKIQIQNKTVAQNPQYRWSVSRSGGGSPADYTISSTTAAEPAITFKRYGAYTVRIDILAQCATDHHEFTVVVNKDPEVTKLREIPVACIPYVLNMRGVVDYDWTNTVDKKLTWTITGGSPTGATVISPTTLQSEYPQIKFTESGDYHLKVELDGVACGGAKLTQGWDITILDPTVKKDITLTGSNYLCEQDKITFDNKTQAVIPITYDWTATSRNDADADKGYQFTGGTTKASPKPEITFTRYGVYTIVASLTTDCNRETAPTTETFVVTVQRDPEVSIAALDPVCPADPLVFDDTKVTYKWNDNTAKVVFWEVTMKDGSPASGVTYEAGALYPEIKFTNPGDYKISVNLEQPAGCGGSKLNDSKIITVRDPAMELNVEPVKDIICEGAQATFTNTSTSAGTVGYLWSVTPVGDASATGWEAFATTLVAPVITFKRYGKYDVKVVMTGECDVQEKTMRITVQKDPGVQLKDYPEICPGALALASVDDYTWRDNPQAVLWTVNRLSGGGTATGDLSGLTPVITFPGPGTYEIIAALTSVGCPGANLTDRKVLTVYPPDIQIQVNVPTEAKEGSNAQIVNNSVGKINSYDWSITGGVVDGWEFVAPANSTSPAPEIKFTKYGSYKIKLSIDGECADSVKYFNVVVKGVPEYKFGEFKNICADTRLDMKDYLKCETKGANITAHWMITPDGDGEYEYINADGANNLFPEIHFIKNGRYKMVLEADAEFGGRQTFTHEINVLRNSVSVQIHDDMAGCTKPADWLKVELTNLSEGDSLNYEWEITPATGWTYIAGDMGKRQPTIQITEQNDYVVRLNAHNICDVGAAEFKIHAYTNPLIAPVTDIRDVCEKGFVFKGTDIVSVQENGDALNMIKWTITPVGARFLHSSDETTLKPDIEFKGSDAPYQMKLEISNGCGDVIVEDFSILVDEFKEIERLRDTQLCALISPVMLKAKPHGGVWTTTPVEMIGQHADGEYYFNPYKDVDEIFEIVYTYGHKSCKDTDTLELAVHKLPVVNAGGDDEICVNLPPEALIPIEPPTGGIWKGTGVTGGQFDPQVAGVGGFKLEYWYTDPLTQCPNVDSMVMTVHRLPDPEFTTSSQHCLGIDSLFIPVELGVGNHFAWNFGDMMTAESIDASITHQYSQAGFYDVLLTATSVHGCIHQSAAHRIEVYSQPPDADFLMDKTEGCGPLFVKFKVDKDKYTLDPYAHLSYSWIFGTGDTSDKLQPDPDSIRFMPPVYDTTYQVTFKVYNACNSTLVQKNLKVLSSPAARFVMMPESGCDPLEVNFANTSTGTGNQYSWTFGDGGTSADREPVHTFRTGKKATPFYIELKAHNDCATTYFHDTITVKPNSLSVKFKMDEKYICAGDTICFINYSSDTASTILNQVWNFGDGQYSSAWDTCHRFDMTGRLEVSVTIDNGCSKAGYTDTVVVYPIPKLTIESEDHLCEDDIFHFELKSDQPLKNVNWTLGDGGTANSVQFAHTYANPGLYTAEVQVVSAEIASCPSKASKTIEAWPKPDVRISPLDTVVCPPFLYQPDIGDKNMYYYKWNYGDGKGITSEMEHLYENDTNYILDFDILAYVETNRGCKSEYPGHIRVYNAPKVGLDKDITYGRPEKVRFINLSRDYTECIWYLPDGRIINSPDDQVVIFENEDTYPLSLAAVNQYGCRDSLYLDYRSYEGGLFFPNTFIPHSSNPKVSHFNGIGMGLKEYRLEIFDLYGNKVWETTTLTMGVPSEGWDGRNAKGQALPQGTYVWRAKAVFFSEDVWTGKNNRSGKEQSTQGTVMLLRE